MAKKGELDLKFVVDTSKPVKNMKELQERVETLRDKIEGAPLGSKEFERLTAQLQKAGSEVKVLEKNMEGLEPQQKAEAFLKMGEGIAGGFAVAQGAMGLMGIENENLEKIQVKVQSAIAIATGVRMMSEAALMAATAKRVAVEKFAIVQTKIGIVTAKAQSVANWIWTGSQTATTAAVSGTTVALGVLRAAIIATGVGALVVGVVALVSAMGSWLGSSNKLTEAENKLAEAQSKKNLEISKTIQHKRALANAESEEAKKILEHQKSYANWEKMIEDSDAKMEKNREIINSGVSDRLTKALEAENTKRQAGIENARTRLEYYDEEIDRLNKLIKTNQKKADDDKTADDAEQRRKDDADAAAEKRREKRKSDAESLRKLEKELLLLEIEDIELREQRKREFDLKEELDEAGKIENKKIRLATIQNIQDIYDQEEINRKKKKDEKIEKEHQAHLDEMTKMNEDYQNELFKKQEDYLNEYYNSLNTAQQNEKNAVIDKYFELLTNADEYGLNRAELEEAQEAELAVIRKKYDDEEAAKDAEVLAAKIETMQVVLDSFSANMDARQMELDNQLARELAVEGLSEEQKLATEEKFADKKKKIDKRQKAIAAAQAVIETYKSAVSSYSALAPIPIVGPTLGIAAAAAAVSMGLANVRQIYAQDVGDGGGGGGGAAPNTSPVSSQSQVASTGAFTLSGATSPEPVKAYVVTDEMTDSQSQLEDIRQQSTI